MANAKEQLAELGDEVLDPVSGFKGVVTGITDHLHGCQTATVQAPLGKDGKWGEQFSIDRPRLKVTKAKKVAPSARFAHHDTGGPVNSAPDRKR